MHTSIVCVLIQPKTSLGKDASTGRQRGSAPRRSRAQQRQRQRAYHTVLVSEVDSVVSYTCFLPSHCPEAPSGVAFLGIRSRGSMQIIPILICQEIRGLVACENSFVSHARWGCVSDHLRSSATFFVRRCLSLLRSTNLACGPNCSKCSRSR